MTLVPTAKGSVPTQKTTEIRRPRSNQMLTVSFEESDGTGRAPRLQYEVAQCVETTTVTTTTTTKRSYPPLFIRPSRPLEALNVKEFPLAHGPTPPDLRKISVRLSENDDETVWSHNEPSFAIQCKSVGDVDGGVRSSSERATPAPEPQQQPSKQSADLQPSQNTRRTRRQSSSNPVKTLQRPSRSQASTSVSDRLRRVVSHGVRDRTTRQSYPSLHLATPDGSEGTAVGLEPSQKLKPLHVDRLVEPADESASQSTAAYEAASPAGSESQTVFSNIVATPPITDTDVEPFSDSLGEMHRGSQPSRLSMSVADPDASLPSPRLSPTLAAAQLLTAERKEGEAEEDEGESTFSRSATRSSRRRWLEDSQEREAQSTAGLDIADLGTIVNASPLHGDRHALDQAVSLLDTRSMLESFDAMPNDMKTFMMYQFLRRCSFKTLRVVANVVKPALTCDFLKRLPTELGLHVLSFLQHHDLCRAAQVSKHWRNMIDSNETGWRELFDRDGFQLASGELKKAITQGWGWQDPEGPEGVELDLSLQNRLTSSEAELRSAKTETARLRCSKRKRGVPNNANPERSKRRFGLQEELKKGTIASRASKFQAEGPISAANEAAVAVPDPQFGLPSLRRLHLFKSLYRRHYMIRQSWTSGKVKPGHVAFAAHPRHVITCLQFDDDKIITGSDDTLIHVYDTRTGRLRKKLEGHEGGVWALQYEGNTLVSGSTDRSVRVWDIEKGICSQVFHGHTSTVRCLQILMPTDTGKVGLDDKPVMIPANPLIITGSRDSQVRVWRLPETGSRSYIQTGPTANDAECPYFVRTLSGHAHSVRSIAAQGDVLVSGSYDATVRVWRISTGEAVHVLYGHTQKVYSVVLDHKRNRCISGSMDSFVKIWDLDTGACLHSLGDHTLLVGLLDLRDEVLVSAAADCTLRIWNPESGKCRRTLCAHTGAITCFQHDRCKVISGSEKTVKMWDIQTGGHVQDLLTDLGGVWQIKFDERRCVAAVQRDNMTYIEILDFGAIRDGKPREQLGKRTLLNGSEVQRLIEEEG